MTLTLARGGAKSDRHTTRHADQVEPPQAVMVGPTQAVRTTSTRIVSELTNQRLNELKALRERDGQRVKLNTTQIVQDAAATTFPDNAEVQADILSMWRKSSGSAHGLIWSLLGGHSSREATAEELTTPPVAAADAEVVVHQRSGEMIALANLYLAVHLIAKRGWKLLDGRGQRADQAVRGRQR